MSEAVARNGIFILKCRHYSPKGDILEYWGTLIFWLIVLLYSIKGSKFIGLKQWIWENYAGAMVSLENAIPVGTTVPIVRGKIFR